MLAVRGKQRNKNKNAQLGGMQLAVPMVQAVARPVMKWTVNQIAEFARGIASAYRSNGGAREEITKAVAPLAQAMRFGSKSPKFTSSSGVVRIEHVESLTVSGAPIVFSTETLTWLRDVAKGFEEYRIKLEISYQPACSATTVGNACMAWDYDPDDVGMYQQYADYFSTADHSISAIWAPGYLSPRVSGWLKTGKTGESRFWSPGVLQTLFTSYQYGFVVVKYAVELRKPQPSQADSFTMIGLYNSTINTFSGAQLVAGTTMGVEISSTGLNIQVMRKPYYVVIWSTDADTGDITVTGTATSKLMGHSAGKSAIVAVGNSLGPLGITVTTAPGGPTSWRAQVIFVDAPSFYF